MADRSTIHTEIDYERNGKQVGYLYLPQSPHEDAWGAILIPIAVIRNGAGPTVLITGGNHGDEYEGPITIAQLNAAVSRNSLLSDAHSAFCEMTAYGTSARAATRGALTSAPLASVSRSRTDTVTGLACGSGTGGVFWS